MEKENVNVNASDARNLKIEDLISKIKASEQEKNEMAKNLEQMRKQVEQLTSTISEQVITMAAIYEELGSAKLALEEETAYQEKLQAQVSFLKSQMKVNEETINQLSDLFNKMKAEDAQKMEMEQAQDGKFISENEWKAMEKNWEEKLSQVTAELMELQDMKQIYIDELDCLKVNLVSAEEKVNQRDGPNDALQKKINRLFYYLKRTEEERDVLKTKLKIFQMEKEVAEKKREVAEKEKEVVEKELAYNKIKPLLGVTKRPYESDAVNFAASTALVPFSRSRHSSESSASDQYTGAIKKKFNNGNNTGSATKPMDLDNSDQGQRNYNCRFCEFQTTTYKSLRQHFVSCCKR